MKKINFQNFKVYADISHKATQALDAREQFADIIYKNVSGIKAYALALKIYNSEGEAEYTPDEVEIIRNVAENLCLPIFIDALNEQLKDKED